MFLEIARKFIQWYLQSLQINMQNVCENIQFPLRR